MKKETETVGELVSQMGDKMCSLGVAVEELTDIREVLSGMVTDANSKYAGELQAFFLYENKSLLQMTNNLMFRLLTEINEDYKQINKMHDRLREQTKVEELGKKKAHSAATE